jgi:predicted glycosyltransferase
MKRLLMYSQDGMGLGHLRRSWNIAQEVLARSPGCEVLILADSPATSLFTSQPGLDVLKLPTIVKKGSASWMSGSWETGTLSSGIERITRLRAKLILDTFVEFQPDTVVIDHMPVGALGEVKPLLDSVALLRNRPRLFLGLRDILDDPEVIRRVWTELDAYEYLRSYDAVLIYGQREVYDATSAYRLFPDARNIVYCHYVVSTSSNGSTGLSRDPFLLMMGGGGSDAFPVADALLKGLPMMGRNGGMRTIILTGPNMLSTERRALLGQMSSAVQVHSALEDAETWIEHASAVVTLGGYNSLCEVLKWRKKALVVPRWGPSAEQRTRTELFSQRNLIKVLEPHFLGPERFGEELSALLSDDEIPTAANIPPLDGAERAAAVLLDGLPSDTVVAAMPQGQDRAERAGDAAQLIETSDAYPN